MQAEPNGVSGIREWDKSSLFVAGERNKAGRQWGMGGIKSLGGEGDGARGKKKEGNRVKYLQGK